MLLNIKLVLNNDFKTIYMIFFVFVLFEAFRQRCGSESPAATVLVWDYITLVTCPAPMCYQTSD